jgi:hypothetical protein
VQLIRNRSRRPQAPAAEAKVIPRASPDVGAKEAPFDPTATRIHVRPAPAIAHSALPKRDEALLPDGAVATLGCLGGPLKGHSFRVTEAGITVGRAPESDIVLSDHRVSHRHAWLGIVDRKVVLRDLESTNGTFLNANLDSLVHEIVLSPGDTIFFGGHGGDQFRFVVN